MIKVDEIVSAWTTDEKLYHKLGDCVTKFIKSEISYYEIHPEITFRTKDLLSLIKKIKKKVKEKAYGYNSLSDKLGVRIICSFTDDLDKVDSFIHSNFLVVNKQYKNEEIGPQSLGYLSNHYDLQVSPLHSFFKNKSELHGLTFELQVRTLNQHVWASTNHILLYKREGAIDKGLKRRIFRLLALYEIADDEFAEVNKLLGSQQESIAHQILNELEGKIYRYAKVDFDRELALDNINAILGYLSANPIMKELPVRLLEFVDKNEAKIDGIFEDYRERLHEVSLITQPEIFLIWYALDNAYHTLSSKWDNDFDSDDLELASTLWGIDF